MADKLRMDYINSLPQPFVAKFYPSDKYGWPVESIEVECALIRIDVCGKLEVKSFADVVSIMDDSGMVHDPETFWADWRPTESPSEPAGHGEAI